MAVHTLPPDINTTRDLYYPAVVAVLASIMSFLATYIISKQTASTEKKSKRTNTLDNLISDFSLLNEIIDKLKIDAEEKPYYMLKNIIAGQTTIIHLRAMISDIVVFSDVDIRREIIEIIENASALFNDLFSIEKYELDQRIELKKENRDATKELRALKMKCLKDDIIIDNSTPPKVTHLKLNDSNLTASEKTKIKNKIEVIENIIGNLVNENTEDNNIFGQLLKNDERKRISFNIRLLDIQTKIREINHKLQTDRTKLLNN